MASLGAASNPPSALLAAMLSHGPVIRYAAGIATSSPVVFVSANAPGFVGTRARAGRRWADLIHVDDRPGYREAIRQLRHGEVAEAEYRLMTDGGARWVRDTLGVADGQLIGTVVDISRERQAEDRARDATATMAAMAGSAMDAVITMSGDGCVLDFNPEAGRMFGYSRAEALGTALRDLIPPAEASDVGIAQYLSGDCADGAGRRIQVTGRRRDGSNFPAELTIACARAGSRPIFVAEIRDISRRLAAEAERDRTMRLLREAIENLPAGFTITGPDDRILLCNSAYAQAMGRPVDALVGRLRRELIAECLGLLRSVDGQPFDGSPEGAERITRRLCQPGSKPIELELVSGDVTIIGSSQLSDGSLVCVRTDVTEIRRAERAVRASAELLQQVLEACPVAIRMTRLSDGRIFYQSPASRSLYGADPQAGPIYARDAFVDPGDCDRLAGLIAIDGGVDGFEAAMRSGDGRSFPAAISARAVEVHGEAMVVGCTVDLTERNAVAAKLDEQREALHQSEKLAALGELLAGVAHELNNPLSVVVGQALLLKETTFDPAITDRLNRIGRAADRCVRIVKTFLSMARRRPKRSEPVCLEQVIHDAVEVAGHALRSSGVRVRLRLAAGLPPVEGDIDQLAQVMTNLIFNAEIAMREAPGERTLTISTSLARHAGHVVLRVRDTGPGVPRALHARVFEPFFTTRGIGVGTGIGLAFCHRVIESHGGCISLADAKGGGAQFTVELPVFGAVAAAAEPAPPPDAVASGRHVLVIDDEGDVADVVAAMLRHTGDRVEIAMSGGEALARLRDAPFDLILSDLRMPGLDGEALFGLLAREQPHMLARLGFITGDAMGGQAQRFLARCGRPFLEKPITPADLSRLVAAIAPPP
ncbi:PAS domain S-box-containing protein [Stella humosa]|uniref:histidine kinase n=1 Tax=Stella humosa TaxID=94 RepID=A0A3N1MF75_9PROT|nr:PAS domain S-box protein [Stella humosa]ROQ01979.1 PAS domain S-box-containing protein [Stella humosa]BBK32368.1 hypothetical protein STHU_30020 [Stella humosa]